MWEYYDKCPMSHLRGALMPMTTEERREWERVRKAKQRAKRKAGQQSVPSTVKRKKPGKTPFASFIKVRNLRRAARDHEYFLDLVIGPLTLSGCWYGAK